MFDLSKNERVLEGPEIRPNVEARIDELNSSLRLVLGIERQQGLGEPKPEYAKNLTPQPDIAPKAGSSKLGTLNRDALLAQIDAIYGESERAA